MDKFQPSSAHIKYTRKAHIKSKKKIKINKKNYNISTG